MGLIIVNHVSNELLNMDESWHLYLKQSTTLKFKSGIKQSYTFCKQKIFMLFLRFFSAGSVDNKCFYFNVLDSDFFWKYTLTLQR